jgi:hypothetical protein
VDAVTQTIARLAVLLQTIHTERRAPLSHEPMDEGEKPKNDNSHLPRFKNCAAANSVAMNGPMMVRIRIGAFRAPCFGAIWTSCSGHQRVPIQCLAKQTDFAGDARHGGAPWPEMSRRCPVRSSMALAMA